MDELRQAVFAALADPSRRDLIEILIDEGAQTPTQLAERLGMSRQGASKHLQILADAGLVTVRQRGREKYYHLTPEPLQAASLWIATLAARWDQRLQALYELLDDEPTDEE